ncbi:GNAT family N-acetyltransferase [Microcoleus sp. FACHB-672]|uniref:GNAT family N-acetyltransferase n=1 Tax=Microcoleus sp. FACHB-672 TaxID=2692825 RepID=UPI001687C3FE|nr:N-acetyltransferase [Microcoleus sp. FACHB-672]MBD2040953.1 N-acetyltransferase [Microcoleus sp. FACHB-672]
MIIIRPETSDDFAGIYEVNKLAFGQEGEAQLVDAIRRSDNFNPELSLVAIQDEKIVGHLLFSDIIIQTENKDVPALALAPLAVHPEFQNQGIGSQLIQQGLKDCQRLGHKIVVVVGHPNYYTRFGFSPARAKGLEAPFPVPDEAFMVLELAPAALEGITGMVKYPPAFDDV